MTVSVVSCIDGGHYEVLPIGKSEFRGLAFLSAKQEGTEGRVRLLVLPDEANHIEKQILTELKQCAQFSESNVLLPFDLLRLTKASLALVYPQTGQVHIAKVLDRSDHALTETVALAVLDALLSAMISLQDAHCSLGGLDPHGVYLLGQKQVQVGPILVPCCQAFAANSPALMVPKDADPQHLTTQEESYAAAILLLCCLHNGFYNGLAQSQTQLGGTQQYVRDEGVHDYIDGLLDVSEPTRELLRAALADEADLRYASAKDFKEDVNRAMAGLSLRIARQDENGQHSGMRSNVFNTVDISEHLNKKKEVVKESAPLMNHKALKALSRLVVVNKSQTQARIILAPGTSFARDILQALLKEAGVSYGINESSFNEATMPMPEVRRIVLATGEVPRPGKPGRSVYGTLIEARSVGMDLEVTDDGMLAYVHSAPHVAVRRQDVEYLLGSKEVIFGVDTRVLNSLCELGSDDSGKTIIARGKNMQPDQEAAFCIQKYLNEEKDQQLCTLQVKRGDTVAVWYTGMPGASGSTVRGDKLTASFAQERTVSSLAGEAVEIHRDGDTVYLKAMRDGVVQKLDNGLLQVVEVEEFFGGIQESGKQVDSDKLIQVYGDVTTGVSIESRAGVRIEGDVAAVSITSCGDVTVTGSMATGDKEVHVAGVLRARRLTGCKIIAGAFEIAEDIIDCELISMGHVWARSIVNSSVTAASDIECTCAGDEEERAVKLWSGHHVPLAIEKEMVQLQEKRLTCERSRMVVNRNEMAQELELMKQKEFRYNVGGFIKGNHMELMHDRLAHMKARNDSLSTSLEEVRHILVGHKEHSENIQKKVDNAHACIHITEVFPGVELKLSESATRVFTEKSEEIMHTLA